MLNKNLLYTAITRAKEKVTIISSIKLLNQTIRKKENRKTLLKEMIIFQYEKIKNLEYTTLNYDDYIS
jgi:ATP-dependent exoDNAse (exonuclease V) alpha subunit